MVEYQILAILSESPQQTMRMSSLAEVTSASLSGCRTCSSAWSGGEVHDDH